MKCCSQLFLLVTLLVSIESIICLPTNLPRVIFGRPLGGFLNNPFRKHADDEQILAVEGVKTGTVTQKLDNFNSSDKRTWQQHYQYNPKFYNGNGLIFLLIGGESKISMRWIADDNYQYLVWAKKHGAAAFQAEHRFYGESHPLPDMSTASYQYFTIDQALADLRVFIEAMNKKYFSDIAKPRWLLFGGSYPGSLSAWLREKNPDITIGAISSSCAVNTITDYWGYIDNMGSIYADVSPPCRDNIKSAFEEIHEKVYTKEGRKELVQKLELDADFPTEVMPVDIQFFLSNVIGIFQGINQYTGDNRDNATRNGLGVPKACEIMNDANEPDLIKRVNNVQRFYNGFFYDVNTYRNPNNYTAYMEQMKNVTYDPPDYERAAARGWTWQTCTELGYFQTTDGGKSMFGSAIPMDFYVNQCKEMFGEKYDADFTRAGTARTRLEHGGPDKYKGTNTVFPNGSYDPWRSLGYVKNQTGDVWAFQIKGTAHCADMYPSSPHDKQSLIDARLFIGEQVDKYIAESLGPSTTTQEPEIPSTTTQKPEIQSTTTQNPEIPSTTTQKPEIQSTTTQKPEIQSTTTKESETSSGTTQKPGKSTTSSAPPLSSFINSLQVLASLILIARH